MSFKRILLLMRTEWATKKKLFLAILTGACLLTIFLCLSGKSSFDTSLFSQQPFSNQLNYKFHFTWFPTFLYATGVILTSLMWYDYKKGQSRNFHLTIPALQLEKWFAKVTTYSFIIPLVLLLVYQVLAVVLNQYRANEGILLVPLSLTDPYLWVIVKNYIIWHAIMIIGAAYVQQFTLFKVGLIIIPIIFLGRFFTEISAIFFLENKYAALQPGFPGPINAGRLQSILYNGGLQCSDCRYVEEVLSSPNLPLSVSLGLLFIAYFISFQTVKKIES